VILAPEIVARLRVQLHANPGARITVDLPSQTVTAPDGTAHRFEVDPFRKQALLSGQDEIALTLGYETDIAAFETRHAQAMPWLHETPTKGGPIA
jgi:3-isopropylmalate/(R)-2-methylmalate dehydratase small subunit